MSIAEIKDRLRDVPGIDGLTMVSVAGRDCYSFDGLIAAVDPSSAPDQIDAAIRETAKRKERPMPAPTTGFAASLRALLDEARAGVAQARADGLARVGEAVSKLNDAKAATAHVAGSMAKTIEDEAAAVLAELGQISNDLGV